ncbi:MAG TPA: carboxypeptidase-like regulatory domain-containing protein, partial [Bryobacteraceae bacterium]|nr:carboxypeptidase-like regulatory domain-containing protein [Bryobacteraceae bacterium]
MRNLLSAGVCFAALALAQTGVVKSEGQPIPGATVKATQGDRILLTLTDANGAFQFDGMTPGAWIVQVDMFGFSPARKEVQIASTPTKIDFTLQLRERARTAGRGGQNIENPAEATLDGLGNAASSEAPAPGQASADASASNESLLVTGSVSQGVQATGADMRDFGLGPGGFGPGGPGGPGLIAGQPGGPGGPGAAGPSAAA